MIPSHREQLMFQPAIAPAVRTNGTVNGTGVDLAACSSQTVVFHFGAYTDGTHTPSVQESSDNSSWSNVAAADLDGTLTAAAAAGAANTTQKVGYIGTRRFIRPVMTTAGATTGAASSAMVVLSDIKKAPK